MHWSGRGVLLAAFLAMGCSGPSAAIGIDASSLGFDAAPPDGGPTGLRLDVDVPLVPVSGTVTYPAATSGTWCSALRLNLETGTTNITLPLSCSGPTATVSGRAPPGKYDVVWRERGNSPRDFPFRTKLAHDLEVAGPSTRIDLVRQEVSVTGTLAQGLCGQLTFSNGLDRESDWHVFEGNTYVSCGTPFTLSLQPMTYEVRLRDAYGALLLAPALRIDGETAALKLGEGIATARVAGTLRESGGFSVCSGLSKWLFFRTGTEIFGADFGCPGFTVKLPRGRYEVTVGYADLATGGNLPLGTIDVTADRDDVVFDLPWVRAAGAVTWDGPAPTVPCAEGARLRFGADWTTRASCDESGLTFSAYVPSGMYDVTVLLDPSPWGPPPWPGRARFLAARSLPLIVDTDDTDGLRLVTPTARVHARIVGESADWTADTLHLDGPAEVEVPVSAGSVDMVVPRGRYDAMLVTQAGRFGRLDGEVRDGDAVLTVREAEVAGSLLFNGACEAGTLVLQGVKDGHDWIGRGASWTELQTDEACRFRARLMPGAYSLAAKIVSPSVFARVNQSLVVP